MSDSFINIQFFFNTSSSWTLDHHGTDHQSLDNKNKHEQINYPKPDNVISFDRLTNVSFSGTNHEENQPCHLTLKNDEVPISVNLELYDNPETRYCPAGVYEIVINDNKPKLQINAQAAWYIRSFTGDYMAQSVERLNGTIDKEK